MLTAREENFPVRMQVTTQYDEATPSGAQNILVVHVTTVWQTDWQNDYSTSTCRGCINMRRAVKTEKITVYLLASRKS